MLITSAFDSYATDISISDGNIYHVSLTANLSWINPPIPGDTARWAIYGNFTSPTQSIIEQWQLYENYPAGILSNNTTISGYIYSQNNMNIYIGLENKFTYYANYTAKINSFTVQRIA